MHTTRTRAEPNGRITARAGAARGALRLTCLLCVVSALGVPAHAALMLNILPQRLEPAVPAAGVVRIRCRSGDAMRYFRGSVIETGHADARWDVVLTVLHGLPDDAAATAQSCVVIGGDGTQSSIRRVWRPGLRGSVSARDWAVMLTDRHLGDSVRRLAIASDAQQWLQARSEHPVAVRLPLLTPSEERACRLTHDVAGDSDSPLFGSGRLFAHNCRAWRGHSGSPILLNRAGRTWVVGIHLGRRRNFVNGAVSGVGRLIDSSIAAAIQAAADAGNEAAAARRRVQRRASLPQAGAIRH